MVAFEEETTLSQALGVIVSRPRILVVTFNLCHEQGVFFDITELAAGFLQVAVFPAQLPYPQRSFTLNEPRHF